jgi:hypothetical protein
MAHQDFAQQTSVEHTMLRCLMDALRATMAWKFQAENFGRQLSTLRFILQSFQRHLEHLLTLEEYDGYMDSVLKASPQLAHAVDVLRQDHETFRQGVRRIRHELEHVASTDYATFTRLCDELAVLLEKLDVHNEKETDLMQEAFERDGGGEG